MTSYDLDGVDLVRVSATSGQVVVIAEDRRDAVVEGAVARRDDATLTVRTASDSVDVRVPEGCSVVVGSRSGQIELRGRFGAVGASSDSGQISVGEARSVDVRTASGAVAVGRATDACRARSQSGRIEVKETADLHAHTDSGSIVADSAMGTVRARTTSGRVEVGIRGASDVAAESIDGTITVHLAAGLGAEVEGNTGGGGVDNSAPPGVDCRIAARSVSGRIEVRGR